MRGAVAVLVMAVAGGWARRAPGHPRDHAVRGDDTPTTGSVARQMLLNNARARQNQPIHFTAVASIAATYKLSASAGLTPALTGEHGWLVVPVIGGVREENPTISIHRCRAKSSRSACS